MRFTFAKYLRNYTIRVVATSSADIPAGRLVQISNGTVTVVESDTTVDRKYLVAEDYNANEPTIVVFVIDKEDILSGFAPKTVTIGSDYEVNIDRITSGTTNKHVKILSKGQLEVEDGGVTYVDVNFSVIGG